MYSEIDNRSTEAHALIKLSLKRYCIYSQLSSNCQTLAVTSQLQSIVQLLHNSKRLVRIYQCSLEDFLFVCYSQFLPKTSRFHRAARPPVYPLSRSVVLPKNDRRKAPKRVYSPPKRTAVYMRSMHAVYHGARHSQLNAQTCKWRGREKTGKDNELNEFDHCADDMDTGSTSQHLLLLR